MLTMKMRPLCRKLMKKTRIKEKIVKGKKTEKAGAAVEEEVLLSCIDVCDSYMQVDIQDAYRFATIDGDYRFGNVTDKDDIPDLEAPTECEDEEKVSQS